MHRATRYVGLVCGACCAIAATAQPLKITGVNVGIMRPLLDGDARVLWMGDSFSVPSRFRVPVGALQTWPVSDWTAIESAFGGDWLNTVDDTGAAKPISSADGYLLGAGGETTSRFGLPVRFVREYSGAPTLRLGPNNRLARYIVRDWFVADGVNGFLVEPGDRLRARLLYLMQPAAVLSADSLRVVDGPFERVSFNPLTQTRPLWSSGRDPSTESPTAAALGQINAAPVDVPITPVQGATPIGVGVSPIFAGSGQSAYPAGAVLYKTDHAGRRLPGLYFSVLADNSWSFADYGRGLAAGEPGAPADQKTFDLDQLTHWLDVTTLDRDQPLYVFYYLAAEPLTHNGARHHFERMVDQTQAAADRVGLSVVRHCIVIPHFHRVAGGTDAESAARFAALRDAAYALASSRPNVAAASIYDATDGVMFDGSSAARDWLREHGFDRFEYGSNRVDLTGPEEFFGNLLDPLRIHPRSEHAAAFFADRLLSVIRANPSCPADLNADGVVDTADLVTLLAGWGTAAAPSDISGDGVVDTVDLVILIAGLRNGC
ncbi:MAG: hypothetical protein D6693_03610 [Planctomycetota bacterium]|nr:MAG: hypothetical protein D6693_03610 [Planctomycetota bacterium]